MDLDAILEDIPENRSSDIGGNAMDILTSVKNGFDIVLKKVADMEKQQNMLLGTFLVLEITLLILSRVLIHYQRMRLLLTTCSMFCGWIQ